jgi:hypothetical protein
VTETLEWWPDYGCGPLWKASGRGGRHADPGALGLPLELGARLAAWNGDYAEDKLPMAGGGDREWLEQGAGLLAEVRRFLAGRYDVVVAEPWWGEEEHR